MPFIGQTGIPEGPVGAGIDVVIVQNGHVVSFATSLSANEDFQLEAIRVLGLHRPLFHKSMGYEANMEIETYVVREGEHPGALWTPGWQADGTLNINTAGLFEFSVIDVDTFQVLMTALNCKLSSQNAQYPNQGLNTRGTSWMLTHILPGLETS